MSLSCRRVALTLVVVSPVLAASVAVMAAVGVTERPARRPSARVAAPRRSASGAWRPAVTPPRRARSDRCLTGAGTGTSMPFASPEQATAARGARGTVVESLGRVWLYTIAEEGWTATGGDLVAVIGPLDVTARRGLHGALHGGGVPARLGQRCHRASPSRIGSVVRAERHAVPRNAQRPDHGQRRQRRPGPGRLADGDLRGRAADATGTGARPPSHPPSATRCRSIIKPSTVRRLRTGSRRACARSDGGHRRGARPLSSRDGTAGASIAAQARVDPRRVALESRTIPATTVPGARVDPFAHVPPGVQRDVQPGSVDHHRAPLQPDHRYRRSRRGRRPSTHRRGGPPLTELSARLGRSRRTPGPTRWRATC